MSWVRFDDQYPIHRKVAGLTDAAFRLHSSAVFWCARNGTDGFVPEEDLDQVCAQVRDPARFAAECVKRRAWHIADHGCLSANCPPSRTDAGWVIHDYLEYQPTKEESDAAAEKSREGKSSGGKLGNHRRWHAARGVTDPDCPWCHPSSVSDPIPIGGTESLLIAPSRPDPPKPDLVDHLRVANARTPDDDDPVISAVIKAAEAKTGTTVTASQAESAIRAIRDRAGKSGVTIGFPARYLADAVASEPDIWDLLGADALAEAGRHLAPDGTHAYDPDPETRLCRRCRTPEVDTRHHRRRTA